MLEHVLVRKASGWDADGTAYDPAVKRLGTGELFLEEAGVALLALTALAESTLSGFLSGFPEPLGFMGYADDGWDKLHHADALAKVAGQLCYMSLGPKRTKNAEARKYLEHILESGHGSVLEHSSATFLLYGVDRAVTHELVRHRAGTAFSQVSQRYVTPETLRFVMPAEAREDEGLFRVFADAAHAAAVHQETAVKELLAAQEHSEMLSGDNRVELRKKVMQAARRVLPNMVEAPIIVTANMRAWRHIITMRASPAADLAIRDPAVKVLKVLKNVAPLTFQDFEEVRLPDGTAGAKPRHAKV